MRSRLPSAPQPPSTVGPVPRDVRKAVERMRQSLGEPLSIGMLAQHCGVAPRTLSKHFREFLGVSPVRFLQRLRLAAAREDLLAGRHGLTITEVAKLHGFYHFGRFATQYRRQFGESPSLTLRNGRTAVRRSVECAPQESDPLVSREKASLAVLPCQTPVSEPELTWLAESVAEGLAAALSTVGALAVKAPKSMRASREPERQARDLNARYVLTGRIVLDDPRLRITLRLVDWVSGQHVWGDSFDGKRTQPLELQDRLIAAVMEAIPYRIRGAEIERASRAAPQTLDAYGLAMRALPFLFASRPDAAKRALELLHHAIDIDPDYGLATALAAWGHGQLVMYNGTTSAAEDRAHAVDLIRRAAILDDGDPLVLAARCAVHTMAHEFDVAEALVARSLALDPTSGWAWGRSAWLNAYRGDSDTAIKQFGRALTLDPNPSSRPNSFAGIGAAYFNAGRYNAAAFWLQTALAAEPTIAWPNRSLSVSYQRLGEKRRARESLDSLRRFSPDITVRQVVAAVPFQAQFLDRLGDGLSDLGLPP